MNKLEELEKLKAEFENSRDKFLNAVADNKYDYLCYFIQDINSFEIVSNYINTMDKDLIKNNYDNSDKIPIKAVNELRKKSDEYFYTLYLIINQIIDRLKNTPQANIYFPGNLFPFVSEREISKCTEDIEIFTNEIFMPFCNKVEEIINIPLQKELNKKEKWNKLINKFKSFGDITVTTLITTIVTVAITIILGNLYKENEFNKERIKFKNEKNELEKNYKLQIQKLENEINKAKKE